MLWVLRLWHRARLAAARVWRYLCDALQPRGRLDADDSASSEGYDVVEHVLESASLTVTACLVFFDSAEGVEVVDGTDGLVSALQYQSRKYGGRRPMHLCDVLTMKDDSGSPFFPLMHFRVCNVEMPSVNTSVHYGMVVYHHGQSTADARVDAYTNRDRPMVDLHDLFEDVRYLRPNVPYSVTSVSSSSGPHPHVGFVRRLLTPQECFEESGQTLVAVHSRVHDAFDAREKAASRADKIRSLTGVNDYERGVLGDMAAAVLVPHPKERPTAYVVLDNTPAVRTLAL